MWKISMTTRDEHVSALARRYRAGCTDVTGFGLIGHLVENLRASGVSAQLSLDKTPLLDGALELPKKGITSSLCRQNPKALKAFSVPETVANDQRFALLFDPQTRGELLAGVRASELKVLKNSDPECWVFGQVRAMAEGSDWDLGVKLSKRLPLLQVLALATRLFCILLQVCQEPCRRSGQRYGPAIRQPDH